MILSKNLIAICLVLSFSIIRAQELNTKKFAIHMDEMESQSFSFLKESIGNKRYVLIGESTHGVREFGELKRKSVEFLVDSMGFSTILIESGLSDLLKWTTNEKESNDSLIYALFPIWHTSSYLQLFQFLKKEQVKIFGIDPQNSSRYFRDFPYEELKKVNENIAMSFYEVDREWSKTYSKPISLWDSSFNITKQKAINIYELALREVFELGTNKSIEYLFLQKILQNRLSMAKNINASPDMFHRDSIMKDNIDWLLNTVLEKNEKVIILSHNAHVAREKSFDIGYLGSLMSKDYNDKIFIIGQYFESGNFTNNKRDTIKMPPPEKNSFEAYLSQFKTEYQIFNLQSKFIPKEIFNKKIKTYYMGGAMVQNFNLSRNYDMIFTVKHANPPIFID